MTNILPGTPGYDKILFAQRSTAPGGTGGYKNLAERMGTQKVSFAGLNR
ncbi:hypothetical protein Misp02_10750 [Microtetraspora sp. NBRC 16547]|nr:hypothetical protein Misp02_10750 [Microtetraspora sp. NBRC 16547]